MYAYFTGYYLTCKTMVENHQKWYKKYQEGFKAQFKHWLKSLLLELKILQEWNISANKIMWILEKSTDSFLQTSWLTKQSLFEIIQSIDRERVSIQDFDEILIDRSALGSQPTQLEYFKDNDQQQMLTLYAFLWDSAVSNLQWYISRDKRMTLLAESALPYFDSNTRQRKQSGDLLQAPPRIKQSDMKNFFREFNTIVSSLDLQEKEARKIFDMRTSLADVLRFGKQYDLLSDDISYYLSWDVHAWYESSSWITGSSLLLYLHQLTPDIYKQLQDEEKEMRDFFTVSWWSVSAYLLKKYPLYQFEEFLKKTNTTSTFSKKKERWLIQKDYAAQYYAWVIRQATQSNDKQYVQVARASKKLLIDKQALKPTEVNKLGESIMQLLLDQKQATFSSTMEVYFRQTFEAIRPKPSPETITAIIHSYQDFFSSLFRWDTTEHVLNNASWELLFTLQSTKSLEFLPHKLDDATSIEELFALQIAMRATPESYPALAACNPTQLRSPHPIQSKSPLSHELYLQKNQRYHIYDETGKKYTWYVRLEVVGEYDENNPAKNTPKYTLVCRDSNNPQNVSYPSGQDWYMTFQELVSGLKFDPIDDTWVVGTPWFQQRLLMNDTNGFSSYFAHMDHVALWVYYSYLEDQALSSQATVTQKNYECNFLTHIDESRYLQESAERIHKRYTAMKIATSKDIPWALRKKSSQDIDAWIDQWAIMLNNDFFMKKYGINFFDPSLWLIDTDWYLDMVAVTEWVNELCLLPGWLDSPEAQKEDKKRRAILLEIRQLQAHEKAHRILHVYGLVDRNIDGTFWSLVVHPLNDAWEENTDVSLVLTNEMLCEIAEWWLYLTEQNPDISDQVRFLYPYKTIEKNGQLINVITLEHQGKTYTVAVQHIEERILERIQAFHPDLQSFQFKHIDTFDHEMIHKLHKAGSLDAKMEWLLETSFSREDAAQITRAYAQDPANSNKVFLFPDNLADASQPAWSRSAQWNQWLAGILARIAQKARAVWIPLWTDATTPFAHPLNQQATIALNSAIQQIEQLEQAWREIVMPVDAQWNAVLGNSLWNTHQDLINHLNGLLTWLSPTLALQAPNNPNNPNNPNQQANNPNQQPNNSIELQWRWVFDNEYKNLPWDVGVWKDWPEKWDILYFKDTVSTWPWWNSDWVKIMVSEVSDYALQIKIIWHTEKDASGVLNQTYEIPRNQQWVDMMKKYSQWSIYKYKEQWSKSDFLKYAQRSEWWNLWWLWNEVSADMTKTYMKDNQSVSWLVTYVAHLPTQVAPYELSVPVYKVEWLSNTVRLTASIDTQTDEDWNVTQKETIETVMDYTSFLHFCKDKKLSPYTEDEIKRSWKFNWISWAAQTWTPQSTSWKDKFRSISSIIAMIKKFPESYKQKFEQEQKLQSIQLYNRVLKWLPSSLDNILFIWDMKDSALAENDSQIMSIIEEYKRNLVNASGDSKWSHANIWSDIIRRTIFEKRLSSNTDRLKACWYLLYIVENAWHPYGRKLKKYQWTWAWIGAILWSEFKQQFLKEQQEIIDQLESWWVPNDELQDRLAKLELRYIFTNTTDHPLFWSRFWRAIEELTDKRWKVDEIDWVKNWVWGKWNIYDIYTAFTKWWINTMLPYVFMWSLLAMEEKVDTEEHYKLFYQTIMIAITTWYTKQFSKDYMDKFKWICRRRGIPIGMFVDDPGAITKSVWVVDYIAKKAWFRKWLYETINERTGWAWNPTDPVYPWRDKINIQNFNQDWLANKVVKVVEDWWWTNWSVIMDAFNYKSDHLISWIAENDYVGEYFGNRILFNEYRDYKDTRWTEMWTGQNPFYNWIFNLDPWTFESYLMNYRGRYFQANQSWEMWQNFSSSITNISSIMNSADKATKIELLRMLLKKRKMYFWKSLWEDWLKVMAKYLEANNTADASDQLNKLLQLSFYNNNHLEIDPIWLRVEDRWNQGYRRDDFWAPPIVQSTLSKYMQTLLQWMSGVTSNEIKLSLVNELL